MEQMMSTRNLFLIIVSLLSVIVTKVQGQNIAPRMIEGGVGDSVNITCTSFLPNEAVNNALQIYNRATDTFESFENNPRLRRISDVGSLTTYTFGPLMLTDAGTIFTCISTQMNSPNATVILASDANIPTTRPSGGPLQTGGNVQITTSKGVTVCGVPTLIGLVFIMLLYLSP